MSDVSPKYDAARENTRRPVRFALTPVEAKALRAVDARGNGVAIVDGVFVAIDHGAIGTLLDPVKTIAIANAALADDDPRRITRETVQRVQAIGNDLRDTVGNADSTVWL